MPGCRILLLCSICLFIGLTLPASAPLAETLHYSDGWAEQGLTIVEERSGGLELLYSIESWELTQSLVAGAQRHLVRLPGALLPNDAGAPDLPGQGFFVAIPRGATARVEIIGYRSETVTGIDMAPAFRIPLETEDGPLDYTPNAAIYSLDAAYPAEPVLIGEPLRIRGVDAVMLGVTPFQYNPVRGELTVYRDIRIRIDFEGGDGHFGVDRLRSRWWEPILQSTFINAASLPEFEQPQSRGRTLDYEYLILSPDDPTFLAWADSIRVFRCEQGIRAGVLTTAEIGGNTTAAIEACVNDAYANWDVPPAAVLLLGDYASGNAGILSPIWDGYCVSDNIYADVDGDDLPEIAFARMCPTDAGGIGHLVTKALEYERHPPTNPDFYANPLLAGGWQTERWFILCEEVLYGFLANELGKSPVREYAIYSGTPDTVWSTAVNTATVVNYFGPNGLGYIPSTPDHLNDWSGDAAGINAALNSGSFILQHRDHGNWDGWGEPSYNISSLGGLSNNDLSFVFSINCLTGKYNYGAEVFSEAFHRHAQGALGLIAASEISYSFVNDAYVWGMYDYFWPDFDPGYGVSGPHKLLPSFANAYGKLYLQASSWPYNPTEKDVTHHLFHHHGDAFTSVYSEMPLPMMISHDDVLLTGVQEFTVMADAGALIGISRDGEYLGSAISMGFPTPVPIPAQLPGGSIVVTVTMQNRDRYRAEVPVVPPDGPYLVYETNTVLDPDGDNDGMLDAAESAGIDLELKNVGIEITTGVSVTLTCDDPHITIVEGTRIYPDIPADGFGSCVEPFAIFVSGEVPDESIIPFGFVATANEGSWDGNFALLAQAPILAAGGTRINDSLPQGGNGSGTADAGETFVIDLSLGNVGHSDAASLTGTLSCADTGVTILQPAGSAANVPEGGVASMAGFRVEISQFFPEPGMVTLTLDVAGEDGFAATLSFPVAVGGWFDEFESDFGWTVSGAASTGIWERVDPIGTEYNGNPIQPEDDYSADPGTLCFVTGNGSVGGAAGENDVDGGATILSSPVYHLEGAATATFSYWRWYSNDQGNNPNDDPWLVQVTSDGVSWVDLENTTVSDASWGEHSFDLTAFVVMTNSVQIRFVADDSGVGGSLVEAGVDDVRLGVTFPILTSAEGEMAAPAKLRLRGNFPNPFNPKTSVRFDLPAQAKVELSVYDVAGRRVVVLVDGVLEAGEHEALWHGRDDYGRPVASGIYFSRLVSGGDVLTRKMVLLK